MITAGDLEELKELSVLLGRTEERSSFDEDLLDYYYKLEERVEKLLSNLQNETVSTDTK